MKIASGTGSQKAGHDQPTKHKVLFHSLCKGVITLYHSESAISETKVIWKILSQMPKAQHIYHIPSSELWPT